MHAQCVLIETSDLLIDCFLPCSVLRAPCSVLTQHCQDFMAQWSLYFSLCLPKKEAQLESSVSCSWDGTMNGRCSCCLPEISSSFVSNVTALPGRPGWWSGQINSMPLFEEHILAPLSNEVMCSGGDMNHLQHEIRHTHLHTLPLYFQTGTKFSVYRQRLKEGTLTRLYSCQFGQLPRWRKEGAAPVVCKGLCSVKGHVSKRHGWGHGK